MSYTIWCERNSGRGIITNVLGSNNRWYVAANNVASFSSVSEARKFFFSEEADSIEPVGSNVWIKGPRGGVYPMRRED